jgi:hypothetical protein
MKNLVSFLFSACSVMSLVHILMVASNEVNDKSNDKETRMVSSSKTSDKSKNEKAIYGASPNSCTSLLGLYLIQPRPG